MFTQRMNFFPNVNNSPSSFIVWYLVRSQRKQILSSEIMLANILSRLAHEEKAGSFCLIRCLHGSGRAEAYRRPEILLFMPYFQLFLTTIVWRTQRLRKSVKFSQRLRTGAFISFLLSDGEDFPWPEHSLPPGLVLPAEVCVALGLACQT